MYYLKCPAFHNNNKKKIRHAKKEASVTCIQEKKQVTEPIFERTQMLDQQRFKATVINMSKELKKAMLKEVKEDMMTISHQIKAINKQKNI